MFRCVCGRLKVLFTPGWSTLLLKERGATLLLSKRCDRERVTSLLPEAGNWRTVLERAGRSKASCRLWWSKDALLWRLAEEPWPKPPERLPPLSNVRGLACRLPLCCALAEPTIQRVIIAKRRDCFFAGAFIKTNCGLLEQITYPKFNHFCGTVLNRVNNFSVKISCCCCGKIMRLSQERVSTMKNPVLNFQYEISKCLLREPQSRSIYQS